MVNFTFNDLALLKAFLHSAQVKVREECVSRKWLANECLLRHRRPHCGQCSSWAIEWKRLKCCLRFSSSFSQLSQSSRGHFTRGPHSPKWDRTCFSKDCLLRISLAQTWQIFVAFKWRELICTWRIYSLAKLLEYKMT